MAILNNFYLMPFMGVTPSSKKKWQVFSIYCSQITGVIP